MRTFLGRVHSDDADVQRLRDDVEEAFHELSASGINTGRHIEGLALVTGQANPIKHKLGRKLLGYNVVLQSADARVWDDQATNKFTSKELILRCSANITVSLWVY